MLLSFVDTISKFHFQDFDSPNITFLNCCHGWPKIWFSPFKRGERGGGK